MSARKCSTNGTVPVALISIANANHDTLVPMGLPWVGQFRTPILFTMVWNRSRDLELNGLGPFIGSKQNSDLPMSEQKEDTMVKKKKAKKAKK
jgi:hypothetical protein